MLSAWTDRIPGRGIFSLLLAACGFLSVSAAERPADSPVSRSSLGESSRPVELATYQDEGGEHYVALSVKLPDLPPTENAARDHVLLVDTSASQVGEHRRQALAVVKAFLDRLPADHRAAVYAVDLETTPLTNGFVSGHSPELESALAQLQRRLPLGATDLHQALNRSLADLEAGQQASILYVGDGMSAAHLLPTAELRELTERLNARKVPVHSYAVGPRKDLQLLGALAQQTGGFVRFDRADELADAPGHVADQLLAAANAPVYYPEDFTVEPAGLSLLPQTVLPLRADRATVYLGKGQLPERLTIRIDGELPPVRFSLQQSEFENGQVFLRGAYQEAEQTDGLSVAFAGNRLLRAAQSAFDDQVAMMAAAGERAVGTRNFELAEEIGLAIKQADPKNVNAQVLLNAAHKGRAKTRMVAFQPPGSLLDEPGVQNLGNQPAPIDQRLPEDGPRGGLIPGVEQAQRINTEKLTLEVNRAIEEAKSISLTAPDEAIELIKQTLGTVADTTDIIPEAKAQLLRRLRSLSLELANTKRLTDQNQIRLAERQAAIEAQKRLVDLATEEERELEQLIDRARALMDEGRHGNDDAFEEAEAVAEAAVNLSPGEGTGAAALFSAEAAGQLNKAFRLRALRADRWLETLYQVELSHVPFPDEPPIVWPPAEVWKALTERRKKWASVDLHKNSPAEEKIQAALINPEGVDIEFIDTPLKDAMDFLADAHEITIIINEQALTEEGVAIDEPINRILSGITLRSALKIMLEPLGLTYIIEDEVMKITTQIEAEEKLSTRVYPVGDLVIPIQNPLAAGLGQGLGGSGGFGGQGGLGAGGQFGQGSAGFGGLQGGGLGAGFSIPSQQIPAGNKPSAKGKAPNGKAQPNGKAGSRRPVDPEVDLLLDRILDERTSRSETFRPQAFAQILDPMEDGEFRLDNKSVNDLKKKVS